MVDIVALLPGVRPHVTATTVRQLSRIIVAMVAMTGRVTMLGLARWAGKGGSYRTIQRFFATVIPWGILFWVFFRNYLCSSGAHYLVAGDEVIVTKAGKNTHGLERFFSSLYGKPGPGLAFFQLSTTVLAVTSVVLEGHVGQHQALQMARQCHLHLISKLRCDAALDFP